MVYLVLAIISSALVSLGMRLSQSKVRNSMAMFVSNYGACSLLSWLFMGVSDPVTGSGMGLAVGFGLFSGVLYLATFVLLQSSIRKNGVVLSAIFMKLGVLIPTIMAIVVFREQPKVLQVLGIVLAIVAIVVINYEKDDSTAIKAVFLLALLLFSSGLTDSTANIYDKLGNSVFKDHYLLYTFISAMLCSLALAVREKAKVCLWDIGFGLLIGIPNYFSSRFLLLALHQVQAVVVYPVYSVATIVVICIAGVSFFHEKLGLRKILAIGMILLALCLLNL